MNPTSSFALRKKNVTWKHQLMCFKESQEVESLHAYTDFKTFLFSFWNHKKIYSVRHPKGKKKQEKKNGSNRKKQKRERGRDKMKEASSKQLEMWAQVEGDKECFARAL